MLFDLCYLGVLCSIIIITFVQVLLPLHTMQSSLDLYSTQILHHLSMASPSPQMVLLFCMAGLLYLKIIWRLINPPRKF